MGRIGIVTVIVGCGVLILGGVTYLTYTRTNARPVNIVRDQTVEIADLKKAAQLLSNGKVADALSIIHQYEDEISVRTELGQQWLGLLIDSSVKTANFGQLIILYEAYPQAFDGNEKASLMVADAYILSKRPQDYLAVREKWQGKTSLTDLWVTLDADELLLEGRKEEALTLLKSSKFEGKKDVDRLVRLALLYVVDNPKLAWDYLAEAYNLDPQNHDILTYRGKLLESLGKDSLALYEYLAAIQAAPDNLFLRDQVAEFYMRRNQAGLALSIWLETLSRPSLDLIWVKALFWSKVITPVTFDWKTTSPPIGKDKPFVDYLMNLPSGTFWDSKAFEGLSKGKKYLNDFQVTFWLRLLEALKKGDEKEARNLLQFNNFSKNLINPQLAKALKQIISYRLTGSLNFDPGLPLTTANDKLQVKMPTQEDPQDAAYLLYSQLDAYAENELLGENKGKMPQAFHDFLVSNEIFSAAFLASHWSEAALQLHKMSVIPDNFPNWIANGLTVAYQTNRSPAEALLFALKQKKTPALSLLIGELYIANNKLDDALTVLTPYLDDKTDFGFRASSLVSVIYVQKQEYDKAKAVIEAQPKLADDLFGKEALARIALQQGDVELADKLYNQLQDQSPEAMSYLARKAFADKDWSRAQELTEKLLLLFPDSPILRENLSKILEEQNTKRTQ